MATLETNSQLGVDPMLDDTVTGPAVGLSTTRTSPLSETAVGLSTTSSSPLSETWMGKSELLEQMNAQLSEIPALGRVAAMLKVRPATVAGMFVVLSMAFLLYGFGGHIVCTLVGCLYPAFESFKTVESKNDKMTQFWLHYWVVFACMTTVEHLLYYILVWIPFYYPIKLCCLFYLGSPRTDGANVAYHWLLKPVLSRNQATIDKMLLESQQGLQHTISGTLSVGANVTMSVTGENMKSLSRKAILVAPVAAKKVAGVTSQILDVSSGRVSDFMASRRSEASSVKVTEVTEETDDVKSE